MREEINAQEKKNKTESHCPRGNKLQSKSGPYFNLT
jgi:hypothetical protein